MRIQIVILNYNGERLLPQCLPSVVHAAQKSRHACRVVILDNPSQAPGLDYVRKQFPEVEIVTAAENKVLCSYNDYLRRCEEDISILLNNDIRVDPGFVDALVLPFEDPKMFLVAPKVMSFDGKTVEAADSRSKIRFGLFWCSARYPDYEKNVNRPGPTATSGFGAFRTFFFNELNGYDPRYLPGIFEDVDLCHRASQAGYKLWYEPTAVVYHIGQATFKDAFKQRGLEILAARNQFLFLWKNYSTFSFWLQHLFWLPFRILFDLLRGRSALFVGLTQALRQL